MAKFVGTKAHTASATLPWLLAFAGFALLLAGVASMQQGCGKSGSTGIGVNQLQEMGAVGYLAPVTCDRFFSFDWFIIFWHFFVWVLVAVFLFSRRVHLGRSMLTSLLAIAATLLMFMCNTWYRSFSGLNSDLTSTFKSRSRTTFAGAIIASIADLLLLIILGIHDEKEVETGYGAKETPTYATATTTAPTGTVYSTERGATTTTTGPAAAV